MVLGVTSSACAERQLVTQPQSSPSASTWLAVGVAAGLAALVLGVLLALPAWRARTGARLAVAVLSAHAGAVVLGGAVLVGVAVRSWQLIDRPPGAPPEPALLRLSTVDGDTAFYAIIVLFVVTVTALVALLLVLGARMAAADDRVGRWIACTLLGALLLTGAAAAVMLSLGSRAWPYVLLAAASPLTATSLVKCWPGRARS